MQPTIKTLGELKQSGYQPKSVKEEVRNNLILSIQNNQNPFNGILGYEDTVIPDVERALLSRHNILFLGLRGQAKTRMAREMVNLLDEWIPIVDGSDINDSPFSPISLYARNLIDEMGDATPITWLHRSQRYGEKLATPDVSVADLIGDVDPIKAANMRLSCHQRIARFARTHTGITLQHTARGRYTDTRLQAAYAVRYTIRIHRQPRRLYQPWQHRYPTERPYRKPDSNTLS
jgi:magnesium chelatase subunit I